MNENMEAVSTEVTTPEETAEGTVSTMVDTQSEQQPTKPAADTTPAGDESADSTQPTEDPANPPVFLMGKYNHEDVPMTREEATANAQLGLFYKDMKPTIDSLEELAAEQKMSLQQLADALWNAHDGMLRNRFLEETGGNERAAEVLLADKKRERQSARDARERQKVEAEENYQQQESDRLATEFIELQKECPEYEKFSDLPKAIVQMASAKKITLCEAALRYERAERKAIEQNQQQQAAAAAATTGSRASTGDDEEDPLIIAMRAGAKSAS